MSPLVSRRPLLPSVARAALVLGPAGTAAATTGPRTAPTETAVAQPSVPDAPTTERADVGRWLDGAKRLHGAKALHPLLGVLAALDARRPTPDAVTGSARRRRTITGRRSKPRPPP
ncbi:hypothetical protein [Streptomyces sp. MAI_2237]